MVEATTKEILQRTKEEEVIRELPVVQWECLVLMIEWVGRLPYTENASYDTCQTPNAEEPQGCMEGTHEQILAELEDWAVNMQLRSCG